MRRYFTILVTIFQYLQYCWTEQTILVVRQIIKGNKFQDGNMHK